MDNERTNERIPKQAFDSEYMTEFLREVRFLSEKGIKYTFVRKTRDYGISQYKYKKTPALFAALVEFYSGIEAERAVRKAKKPYDREDVISPEQIKKAQEILEKAMQQNIIKAEEKSEEEKPEEKTEEKDDTI